MSYPTGDQTSPPNGSKPGQRPSLDRPSLFAGMEDGTAVEDTQRVRILSTLESTRRTSRPHRTRGGRQTHKGQRSIWLQGALWGAMGMGVLALMAGFILVIQDSKPAQLHAAPATPARAIAEPATAQAKADAALNAASSPTPALSQGPAVIETSASVEPAIAASPTPVPAASAAAPATPDAAAQTLATAPQASHPAEPPRKADDTSSHTKISAAAPPKSGKSKPAKGQDDDVALLEAMFAHTGRKAPAPAHKN